MADLEGLFNAQRVAIIGVSNAPGNFAQGVIRNMRYLGYQGEVYLVGRSGGEMEGLPILPDVEDIPGTIDLAIPIVPAQSMAETIEKCGRKGARWISTATGGFSEFGEERRGLEEDIRAALRRHGMRLVGPNALGVLNTANNLVTLFAPVGSIGVHRGPVSVFAQSGGIAQRLAQDVSQFGPGLNKLVSTGNKLDLDEADYLDYFANDPSTEVIVAYLEGIKRGEEFVEAARRCTKPIILFKHDGVTSAATASRHSAGGASDDRVVDAAMRRAGVVRARRLNIVGPATGILRLPRLKGNRLAIMSMSGGPMVVSSALAEKRGFVFPKLDPALLAEFESWGKAGIIKLDNPLDMAAINPLAWPKELAGVVSQPNVDAVVLVFHWLVLTQMNRDPLEGAVSMVQTVKKIMEEHGKPIILTWLGRIEGVEAVSRQVGFPMVLDPEDAIETLCLLRDYYNMVAERERAEAGAAPPLAGIDRSKASVALQEAIAAGQNELIVDCAEILASYGLRVGTPESLGSAGEAIEGGEVNVAAKRDAQFGPVVELGLGGTCGQMCDEVSLRMAPVSVSEAREMIEESRVGRLPRDPADGASADWAALADVVVRLSWLIKDNPEINAVELNGVRVLPGGQNCVIPEARLNPRANGVG